MRSDIVPGAVFPDYELPDHTTKRRRLSELQGQHPMVLVLSRDGFCPKDRRQAEGLVALHRELEVGYCRLATISTDNITETNVSQRRRRPLAFPLGREANRPKRSRHRRIAQRGSVSFEHGNVIGLLPKSGIVLQQSPDWRRFVETCPGRVEP